MKRFEAYGDILTYIKSKVTLNYTEKFINRSMDYIPETTVCITSNNPFHIKYLQEEKASEANEITLKHKKSQLDGKDSRKLMVISLIP
ncbi:hypothetical protein MTR_2g045640 [Medicago truncatula]|uniref:Uncharacterized protein n=1 Tax=Medicago truncatula TaxID=3880 RepID=G7IST6_MEDTR|nr:hypothetical protein MTR_2g045640 [Medicago truncatula]